MRKYLSVILLILICFTASCDIKDAVGVNKLVENHDTPMIEEKVEELDVLKIQKFKFPLPEKYKDVRITSSQGLRDKIEIPNSGGLTTSGSWHQGFDFACPEKTPVYAAKDGYLSIVYPGYLNGSQWKGHSLYGSMIVIAHPDGTYSLYAHLSKTLLKEGTYVKSGDNIALSGGNPKYKTSGVSTGSHLHFAVYLNMNNIFE